MYQSRPIMEQIKHMIFQSKQCLLIQNLIPEYFTDNRQDKEKKMSSTVCFAAGCRSDAREDFILTKFNELYYLSCEKDDTYRFNIRQNICKDGEQNGVFHKKGTFYDDQPQEQSSDDSDDLTSYMVDTYVSQAVQQDPDDLHRFQEKILREYMAYKNLRKQRGQPTSSGQDERRGKKLRDKLRINSGLQMVQFFEAPLDEEAKVEDDEDANAKSGKAGHERDGWPAALGGLLANPKLKREEYKEDKKDDEAQNVLNVPRRVVSRQDAKEKDKRTKESYPKFKLSLAFGYGQFISSENLFEVYDTKLVSQAEKDDVTREQKKQRREQDIQEKREQHQQAIKNLLKDKLRSSNSQFAENMKYKPANMDRERFHYRVVKQGQGGSSIYIVTPIKLLEPVEDKTGTMEKFVRDIAVPKQYKLQPIVAQPSQRQQEQMQQQDISPLDGSHVPQAQIGLKEEGSKQITTNEVIKGRSNVQGDRVSHSSFNLRVSKYQTRDQKLAQNAMARLNVYRQKFQNIYEMNPSILEVDLESVQFEDISEKDSILETNSDDGDQVLDTERTRKSPSTPEKSQSCIFLNLKGRGRTMSTNVHLGSKAPNQLSPQKSVDKSKLRPRKQSVQMSNLQFLFRPSGAHGCKKEGQGMQRRQSFIEKKTSLNDTHETSQNQADNNQDSRSKNEILEESSLRNISADFFEVESECDIDSRPEMCRVTLEHIKHVHLSRLQRRLEGVESVRCLIEAIHVEHELDQKMNDDLKLQITKIKEKRRLLKERKEKVIQDYQIQESTSQMQLLANLNTNTAFKPIDFQECMRVHAEPIQIIRIVENKPQIYRQKDIFTPIISKAIQTQENYVFTYDFQDMNEPKFKTIRKSTNAEKRRNSLNQSAQQYQTFIYQEEMSPAFVEYENAEDEEAILSQQEEAACFDKFDHLSSDRQSEGGIVSSGDDLELPVLVRLENAKQKKKQTNVELLLKPSMLHKQAAPVKPAKHFATQKSVKFGSSTTLSLSRQRSERSARQLIRTVDIEDEERQHSVDQNGSAGDATSQDAQESARKKKNLKSLQKGLKQRQINLEQRLRRHQHLKIILTNKPINFFNPDAGKKLQADIERMNKETETDQFNNLLQSEMELEHLPKPQNLPLKNLVHTVSKVMEGSDKAQMYNSKDEGMSEAVSQKLRRAIEVNQPQVIQDFVLYNGRAIDLYDKDGFTLLCRAVHYGRSDIVELLLKAGADPSKPCRDSEDTPLHIAVNFNFKKVQDLLLDHNANETKLNRKGLLPWQGIVHQN